MSAPIKSFKQLLTSIARRLGKLEDNGTIDSLVSGDLTDLATTAMRYAWQFYPWPDAKVTQEETVISHPTVTGAVYVPRQTSTRTLATVFEVWSDDLRKKDNKAYKVPYQLHSDGIYFYDSITPVWPQFRDLPPEYSDTVWATAHNYAVDDAVLFTDGHCYRCVIAHTSAAAFATDLAAVRWVQVPVLACLYEPVKQGVISHWTRSQAAQPMTAKTFEDLMFDNLTHEVNQIQIQEGQHLFYN